MEWITSKPLSSRQTSLTPLNVEIPPLFQPVCLVYTERKPTENDFKMDATTTDIINLLKYIRNLSCFSEQIDSKSKQYETTGNSNLLLPLLNTVLEPPPASKTSQNNSLFSTNYTPESTSNVMSTNVFLNCKTLDPLCKMRLLQRSVHVSCLIEGLGECDQHVLDTLTDILDNFYSIISNQLACTNLARSKVNKVQNPSLMNLQKVLIDCGVGTISDVLHFQNMHFLDRNKKLLKLSEAAYKECLSKQEKLRKQFSPETIGMTDMRILHGNITECLPSGMDSNVWKDGTSLKRNIDSMLSVQEENFIGIYGHVEKDQEACINPTKKLKT